MPLSLSAGLEGLSPDFQYAIHLIDEEWQQFLMPVIS